MTRYVGATFVVVKLLQLAFVTETAYSDQQPQLAFTTRAQEVAAFEGESVEIRCTVTNLPSHLMVFWLNGSMILSSSRSMFVKENRRVSVEGQGDMYNLKIRDLREWDDGMYICQVPGPHPIVQTNRLTVKKPASIQAVYPGTIARIRERENLQLECRAIGRPRPTVTWTRQDKQLLPVGRYSEDGELLTAYSVHRSAAGVYVCTASNGVGNSVNRSISVFVEYRPVVNVTTDTLFTGPSQPVSIECIVQAEPEAELIWYHNNTEIPAEYLRRRNIRRGKEKIGESTFKFTLGIPNLQPRDLGSYKCEARNERGFNYQTVTLSPFPYNLIILSKQHSYYRDQYTLQWKVSSHSPVIDFILFLKQVNDSYDTPWVQYNIPATPGNRQSVHSQEYILRGLVPNSLYLATMRARNVYGDSNMSDEFEFRTALGLLNAVPQPVTLLVASVCLAILKHVGLMQ